MTAPQIPARPDDTPLAGRAAALADDWDVKAVEQQAHANEYERQGLPRSARTAHIRARQLGDCANELRALLEET